MSADVKALKEDLGARVASGEELASRDFPPKYRPDAVREQLWLHHRRKCAYCERKRDLKRESDVEHFRPKAGVSEDPAHLGYWWLAYEWENLLYACKACNQEFKKTHFPIGGVRAYSPNDDLGGEIATLIDPVGEDPSEFIGFIVDQFDLLVKPVSTNQRGQVTITILGLDRPYLMEERTEALPALRNLLAQLGAAEYMPDRFPELRARALAAISRETSSEHSFAGFRRSFFSNIGMGDLVARD